MFICMDNFLNYLKYLYLLKKKTDVIIVYIIVHVISPYVCELSIIHIHIINIET